MSGYKSSLSVRSICVLLMLTAFTLATPSCRSTKPSVPPVNMLDGHNVRLLEDAGRHTWVTDGHTNTVWVKDGVPLYVVTGDGLLYLVGIIPAK